MATKKTGTTKKKGDVSKAEVRHIKRPHLTEKATFVAEKNIYTFIIHAGVNKRQVADAIQALYGVTPKKVNIVAMKKQYVVTRGRLGQSKGYRKAYVFLKKGDKITLM